MALIHSSQREAWYNIHWVDKWEHKLTLCIMLQLFERRIKGLCCSRSSHYLCFLLLLVTLIYQTGWCVHVGDVCVYLNNNLQHIMWVLVCRMYFWCVFFFFFTLSWIMRSMFIYVEFRPSCIWKSFHIGYFLLGLSNA